MAARVVTASSEDLPLTRQRSNSVGAGTPSPDLHLPLNRPGLLTKDRRRRSLDCRLLQQTKKIAPSSGLSLPKQPKQIVHSLKTGGQDLNNKPKKVLLSIKRGSENGVGRVKKAGKMLRDVAVRASGAALGLLPKRKKSEPVVVQASHGMGMSYTAPVVKKKSTGRSVSMVHLIFLVAFFVVQMVMGPG